VAATILVALAWARSPAKANPQSGS
jgi:hypothetical protein